MRKEILFAVVLGGALGLVIAYGIWRANSSLRSKDTSQASPSPTSFFEDFKIVLAKPDNQAVLTDTPIVVSGITKANAYVIISAEETDEITNASSSGAFSASADLTGGANQIKLFAFDVDGSEADVKTTVIYSSQFVIPTQTKEASTSGDVIRDNVTAKIQAATSAPLAYIGVVTDITDSAIQIKNGLGEIQQISTNKDSTVYVKTTNDTTKQVKSTDVAIGDFLIAMGVRQVNDVLSASRILITDPIKETTRRGLFGTVTASPVGKITVKNEKTNDSISVTPADSLQITGVTKFSAVKTGDKIIAVGEFANGTIDARTIQVVK